MSKLKTVWDAVNYFRGDLNDKYVFDEDDVYLFYCIGGDYMCSYSAVEGGNAKLVCSIAEFESLTEEMESNFGKSITYHSYKNNFEGISTDRLKSINKPLVYTQEMADNGELPSVGMKCSINFSNIDNAWYECIIDLIGSHVLVASGKYVNERWAHIDDVHFKPVGTRTTKEKAIDELRNLDDSICNDIEWHANFLQAIIDGKINGVKWVGEQ